MSPGVDLYSKDIHTSKYTIRHFVTAGAACTADDLDDLLDDLQQSLSPSTDTGIVFFVQYVGINNTQRRYAPNKKNAIDLEVP